MLLCGLDARESYEGVYKHVCVFGNNIHSYSMDVFNAKQQKIS